MRIEGLDFGSPEKENIPYAKREHITLLIGSGFSVPCGMPTGKQLNNKILNINNEPITEAWNGMLAVSRNGQRQKTNSPQEKSLDFLHLVIKFYNENIAPFDYEAFYDYLHGQTIKNTNEIQQLAKPFISEYSNLEQLLYSLDSIYIQIIEYYLGKDRKTELQENEFAEDKFPDYQLFIQWLNKKSKDNVINIFSLNHDLLIENLSRGNWLQEKVSDGFDDYRSRYFGDLVYNGKVFNCRLEEYTGRYDTAIRLYKLHGSLDYILFKRPSVDKFLLIPDKFIKVPREIDITKIKKQRHSEIGYDYDLIEYHSNILAGTKTKQKSYNKFLYKKLFRILRNELKRSSKLIIIGYGGRDEGINQRLLTAYDYNHKPTYIFDPSYKANNELLSLGNRLHAHFYEKSIAKFDFND